MLSRANTKTVAEHQATGFTYQALPTRFYLPGFTYQALPTRLYLPGFTYQVLPTKTYQFLLLDVLA